MISRIPDRTINDRTLADLHAIRSAMDSTRAQLSSGRRILRPSDDPAGAATALQLKASMAANERYTKNAQSAVDEMNVTDGLLQSANSVLRNVRDLVIQGGNGALNQASLSALADQVRHLRDELVTVANGEYGGAPVFSGTGQPATTFDTTPPYAYNGDSGARERGIGQGVYLTTNLTGDTVFGTGATSAFALLDRIADNLDAGQVQTLITTDLGDVDTASSRILSGLSMVGARTNRAQDTIDRLMSAAPDLERSLSDVIDTDMASAITDVQLQQVAYQATLSTLANIVKPSLLDFLR